MHRLTCVLRFSEYNAIFSVHAGYWAGPQPVQAPRRCTKCNSTPINGQCTNHRTAVNCLKKYTPLMLGNNFGKYGPIFTILSPVDS